MYHYDKPPLTQKILQSRMVKNNYLLRQKLIQLMESNSCIYNKPENRKTFEWIEPVSDLPVDLSNWVRQAHSLTFTEENNAFDLLN